MGAFGDYQLLERLGSGAMASVWRARHAGCDEDVALKILSSTVMAHSRAVRRFQQEAAILAYLEHPLIPRMFDQGSGPHGRLFIAMEFLQGVTLKQYMKSSRPLSLPTVCKIVQQLCHALEYAHRLGLVHRDVKPANVLLSAGRVYLLDFGVAKAPDWLAIDGGDPTRTGAMVGTPLYMSPEQARGSKTLDRRSDLWSVSVIAYECLFGKVPFRAKNIGELVRALLIGPPPVIPPHCIDDGLNSWIIKGLERDAEKRFESAAKLAAALFAAVLQQRERSGCTGNVSRDEPATKGDISSPYDGVAMGTTL